MNKKEKEEDRKYSTLYRDLNYPNGQTDFVIKTFGKSESLLLKLVAEEEFYLNTINGI